MRLRELGLPVCVAGGSRIDDALALYLRKTISPVLRNVEETDGMVYDGLKHFQDHAKRTNTMRSDDLKIDVAGSNFNQDQLGIRKGTMTINACVLFLSLVSYLLIDYYYSPVADEFFRPFVDLILSAIRIQTESDPIKVRSISIQLIPFRFPFPLSLLYRDWCHFLVHHPHRRIRRDSIPETRD